MVQAGCLQLWLHLLRPLPQPLTGLGVGLSFLTQRSRSGNVGLAVATPLGFDYAFAPGHA